MNKKQFGYFDIDIYRFLIDKGHHYNVASGVAEVYTTIVYILNEIKSLEPMMLEALSKRASDVHLSEIARYTAACRAGIDARSKTLISKLRMNLRLIRKHKLDVKILEEYKEGKNRGGGYKNVNDKDSALSAESNNDAIDKEAIAMQYNNIVHDGQGVVDQKTVSLLNLNVSKHGIKAVIDAIKAFACDAFAKKIGHQQTFFRAKFNDFLNNGKISSVTTNVAKDKSLSRKELQESKKNKDWQSYVENSEHNLSDNDKDWHLWDVTEGWYVNYARAPKWYHDKLDKDNDKVQESLSGFWKKIGYGEGNNKDLVSLIQKLTYC